MKIKSIQLCAKNRGELRLRLTEHHDSADECRVAVKRGRLQNDGIFGYIDAV